MGKGQRHSKNAGVMGSEGLSAAERRALGYGTVKQRLGKESFGNYDDCCLTLQTAKDPVVTPQGYVFSREAILENLLKQKKMIKRKMAAWEGDQATKRQKASEKTAVEQEAKLIAFDRANHMGISDRTANNIKAAIEQEAQDMQTNKSVSTVIAIKDNEERAKQLKAFWMPSLTPSAEEQVEKPDENTYCPASGKKLRLKDLVTVNFTPVPEGETDKHMDPITKDTITNASKLVVLKPTGDVLLKETWEKCIKPEGEYQGHKITDKDVIELQTSATGFVARDGDKIQTQKHWTLGPGSGLADLRGQHQGPRSLGGLQFWN